ncbi:hypothetical protein QQ045_005530 [Rhodiola kirilowii]
MALGRWFRPEVVPLMAAMTFVTSMCAFQLARNVLLNPYVRADIRRLEQADVITGADDEESLSDGQKDVPQNYEVN